MWQGAAVQAGGNILTNVMSGLWGKYYSDEAWKRQKKILKNQIQWRVADMRAAGLNPLLAITQGAQGGAAPQGRAGPAGRMDLAQAAQAIASAKAAQALTKKTEAETKTIDQSRDQMISNLHSLGVMQTSAGALDWKRAQVAGVERDMGRAYLPYVIGTAKALDAYRQTRAGGFSPKWERFWAEMGPGGGNAGSSFLRKFLTKGK